MFRHRFLAAHAFFRAPTTGCHRRLGAASQMRAKGPGAEPDGQEHPQLAEPER